MNLCPNLIYAAGAITSILPSTDNSSFDHNRYVNESSICADQTLSSLENKHIFLYSRPVSYDPLNQKLAEIRTLNDNWDGYGAVVPNEIAIGNTSDFLKKIGTNSLTFLDEESITPTPYGTIVLDFEKGENLVSIEIGDKKIGFFTDFEIENKNTRSKGINIIGNRHIPEITKVLNELVNA